jgi:hypothetical protein
MDMNAWSWFFATECRSWYKAAIAVAAMTKNVPIVAATFKSAADQ